jgi:hypothetical protein
MAKNANAFIRYHDGMARLMCKVIFQMYENRQVVLRGYGYGEFIGNKITIYFLLIRKYCAII